MSQNAHFPRLFSALRVGRRTLRNRIALSATLTNYGAGHRVTERWIDFLAERAKGGAAMLVTEIIAVDPAALAHGAIVTGYDAANEDGFRRAAAAVEGEGACLTTTESSLTRRLLSFGLGISPIARYRPRPRSLASAGRR